jgi:hypothetical protein
MVAVFLATLAILDGGAAIASRMELGDRLKRLDQTWISTPDKTRRLAATEKITSAFTALSSDQNEQACRALDEATATLLGRTATPEDAVSLRFEPAFVEPRSPAKLRIGWAYEPVVKKAVRIQIGGQTVVTTPGRDLTVEVRPEQLNPEILQNPEVGYLMPVQVGPEQRSIFLSIVKKPKERIAILKTTKQPEALYLCQYLEKSVNSPDDYESDLPIIQYLFTAELLDEGRLRLDRADTLPLVKYKDTVFRATFPRQVRGPLTVVIGLNGIGGSENMYFDLYGHGSAVTEATKRNWAFISPRNSASAVSDVLEWVRKRRSQAIERVFILGHGSGSTLALEASDLNPKPAAIALVGAGASSLPSSADSIPIFFAVGKQDPNISSARSFAQLLAPRKGSVVEEVDASEQFMIVADAIPSAFRFFDARSGR